MSKKAFTLIELLVVIAIIALLMAIIMPALKKVKEQARMLICKTNLHSFGTALLSYSVENDGRFVPGDYWYGMTIYVGEQWSQSGYGPALHGRLIEGDYLPLPKSQKSIYYCPSDKVEGPYSHLYEPQGPNPYANDARWFAGRWGDPGPVAIDAGYEFRDSMDGTTNDLNGWWGPKGYVSQGLFKGARSEKMRTNVIISDWFAGGVTSVIHHYRYNLLLGDSSVVELNEKQYEHTDLSSLGSNDDPRDVGITNWILAGALYGDDRSWNDSWFFDAVDYILGNGYYKVPEIPGLPGQPGDPYWR